MNALCGQRNTGTAFLNCDTDEKSLLLFSFIDKKTGYRSRTLFFVAFIIFSRQIKPMDSFKAQSYAMA